MDKPQKVLYIVLFCNVYLLITNSLAASSSTKQGPVMAVATWPFTVATDAAWEVLTGEANVDGVSMWGTALAAVTAGCTAAEADPSIHSVGYGNSPDENGHTTLDAMVMDGRTMEAGAVAAMPNISQAAHVALKVLQTTKHTLLVGDKAAEFAQSCGFRPRSLDTPESYELWKNWQRDGCQPNYRRHEAWVPDPSKHCGPYKPILESSDVFTPAPLRPLNSVDHNNHDTIGMVAIDQYGSMAVGLSTSGASHKIPGRVGDTPIPGAGGYVDNEVGGAVGTGDGDVMMRFLLSYQTVQHMRQGIQPTEACAKSLRTVRQNGTWSGALVAVSADGTYGAACVGFGKFPFSVRTYALGNASKVFTVDCLSE
ncbi:hypothetical protein P879_02649 [Paragonimus westermani]|uniref:N4-(Beta-N-acetylglucosaminyl)-L-asparaginase n=1 Tax=Paragonimus westermani TaxID=34504 RepID=A0A8T0DNJ1_9TREM|nr:hypothetical protein P879_02649 [Paragonimus westermani]